MDAILSLIKVNEEIDYGRVILIVLLYVVALWLMISIWTGRDATKRYGTPWAGIVWGVAVFFLGFPAFMFFLVVRPEEPHDASTGGVHIPIANFVDPKRDEIVMGVQLVLHTRQLTDAVRDMRIDIDWESSDPAKQITPESIGKETAEVERKIVGLGNIYKSLKQRIDSSLEEGRKEAERRRIEREKKELQRMEEQKLKLEAEARQKAKAEAKQKAEAEAKVQLEPTLHTTSDAGLHQNAGEDATLDGSAPLNPAVAEAVSEVVSDSPTEKSDDSDKQAAEEQQGSRTETEQTADLAQVPSTDSSPKQPHPAHELFAGRRHKKKKRR